MRGVKPLRVPRCRVEPLTLDEVLRFLAAVRTDFHPFGGGPSPSDQLRSGYGRIFFAHSELRGTQAFAGAHAEGYRAALQVMAL